MSWLALLPAMAAHTLLYLLALGALICTVTAAALRLAGGAHPRARYVLAVAGFALAATLPLVLQALRLEWRTEPPAAAIERPVERSTAPAAEVAWLADRRLGTALLGLWVAGIVVLTIRGAAGWWALARLKRSWAAAPAALRRGLGWPDAVPLFVGSAGQPMAIGLWRGAVYLPLWLTADLGEEAVARIARHELAHVRWKDPLVDRLIRATRSALWPAAPLWMLERLARREREAAADHGALQPASTRRERRSAVDYAAALLAVAERRGRLPVGVGAIGELEERVRRLLRPAPAPRRGRLVLAGLVLFAGTACGMVLPLPAPAVDAPAEDRRDWGPLDHFLGYNPEIQVVISPGVRRVRIEGHELSSEMAEHWLASRSLTEKAEIVRSAAAAAERSTSRAPDEPR